MNIMIVDLAWRNIWRNKLRSIVIVFSVALGVLAGLIVLSLYKGMMNGRVRTLVDTETGHIQIHDKKYKTDQDPNYFIRSLNKLQSELSSNINVKGFSQRTLAVGMLSSPSGSTGVSIIGINVDEERTVSRINKKLKEGSLEWPNKYHGIIIGKKLSKKLKIKLGSKVVITTTDTADNIIASSFRVTGIYQTANAPLDEINVFVNKQEIQEILGLKNQIHEISILLMSDTMLTSFKSLYKTAYPSLEVESWKDLSPETELMVVTVDTYSLIILVIIFIALSFGIMNTMMMAVLERRHEIGMMLALGMGKMRLLAMIVAETFFLTMVGMPIAILAGKFLIDYYERNGLDLSGMGKDMMESFGFETLIYPSFPVEKLPSILILVFITAILSSILPIWKSLKLDPVTTLQK